VTLDARRAGDALSASSEDLARVWRAGRSSERPAAFPGLLDGVIESFMRSVGDALATGRDAALVWTATSGVVRLVAGNTAGSLEELDAEWNLVEEVLVSALRSLEVDKAVVEWAVSAVGHARAGTRGLQAGGPPGVLAVRLHSDPAAMRRARSGGSW
jgi:hypothetical protein